MDHDTASSEPSMKSASNPSAGENTTPYTDSSVDYINTTVTDQSVVSMNAAGQAYQSVANSMALAVENSSTTFLNFSTIAAAALAKATENYMLDPTPTPWPDVIKTLQAAIATQADIIKTVGANTSGVMQSYRDLLPSGGS
jgi:hypothetical protein